MKMDPGYGDYTCVEDIDLDREMDSLGLPTCFNTSKEKRISDTGGKRRGRQVRRASASPVINQCEDHVHQRESTKENDEEILVQFSSVSLQNTSLRECQSKIGTSPCLPYSVSSSFVSQDIQGEQDNHICGEFGDWKIVWDGFHMRYFFYNSQTQESTWDPPAGLESLDGPCISLKSTGENVDVDDVNAITELICDSMESSKNIDAGDSVKLQEIPVVVNESIGILISEKYEIDYPCEYKLVDCHLDVHISNEESHLYSNLTIAADEDNFLAFPVVNYRRKHKRRSQRNAALGVFLGMSRKLSVDISKYWNQRYLLFSQFDKGIKMDEEGWFSVTPEAIAKHQASRCGTGLIIDCFSGVGGNSIQFAMKGLHVIAIDIDPHRVDFAKHNAVVYGVGDKIDFVNADFLEVGPALKADVVFLSPPWGGPNYLDVPKYDIKTMLKPVDGFSLFQIASAIAPKVLMYLPRNVDFNQLAELSLCISHLWTLEIEKNYLNGKLKAVTAYFDRKVIED